MKTNVLVIHGGDTFPSQNDFVAHLKEVEIDLNRMKPSRRWKDVFVEDLGTQFEVFFPRMPLADNADYELWKLWFERILQTLGGVDVVIGHSLGAMFLIKYYSEETLEKPISALYLLAPEYFGVQKEGHVPTTFDLRDDISEVTKNAQKVVFFHSQDDPVVPFENMAVFQKLLPDAVFKSFSNKGHFNVESFPELVTEVASVRQLRT